MADDPELMAAIEATQAALQPLFSKPKLSVKLLSKPPFRFLHDVVSALTAATGFASGLFEEAELDARAIKDKAGKLGYLTKLLEHTQGVLGETIDVRPSKIVAGSEPVNTNHLLQAMGRAATGGGGGDAGGDDGAAEAEAAAKEAAAAEAAAAEAAAKQAADAEAAAASAAAAAAADAEAQRRREEEAEAERQRAAKAEAAASQQREAEEAAAKAHAAEERKSVENNAAPAPAGGESAESLSLDGSQDRTRELLQPLISRPKLSDKLLGKPPMRFIHDIVMNVQQATNWGVGLFEDWETDSKNFKEKDAKLGFLNKVINCLSMQLGFACPAHANKIVAGADADSTNVMFQMLAVAATRSVDPSCVARAATGEKFSGPAAAPSPAPAPARESSSRSNDDAARREREREEAVRREEEARAERQRQQDLEAAREKARREAEEAAKAAAAEEARRQADAQSASKAAADMSAGAALAMPSAVSSGPPLRSARPQTAGRRPPRVKENAVVVDAVKEPVQAVGVMREGADESDSDDDAPAPGAGGDDGFGAFEAGAGGGSQVATGAAVGKHTRAILNEESKSESKDAPPADMPSSGGGIKMGRIKKSRQDMSSISEVELDQLREAIQKLCRSTDPLGRSMEYVHEDMDVMKRELEQWKSDYARRQDAMESELKESDEALVPLKRELAEVEEQIQEQHTKINAVKATISKNDVRIQELLRMVSQK